MPVTFDEAKGMSLYTTSPPVRGGEKGRLRSMT